MTKEPTCTSDSFPLSHDRRTVSSQNESKISVEEKSQAKSAGKINKHNVITAIWKVVPVPSLCLFVPAPFACQPFRGVRTHPGCVHSAPGSPSSPSLSRQKLAHALVSQPELLLASPMIVRP